MAWLLCPAARAGKSITASGYSLSSVRDWLLCCGLHGQSGVDLSSNEILRKAANMVEITDDRLNGDRPFLLFSKSYGQAETYKRIESVTQLAGELTKASSSFSRNTSRFFLEREADHLRVFDSREASELLKSSSSFNFLNFGGCDVLVQAFVMDGGKKIFLQRVLVGESCFSNKGLKLDLFPYISVEGLNPNFGELMQKEVKVAASQTVDMVGKANTLSLLDAKLSQLISSVLKPAFYPILYTSLCGYYGMDGGDVKSEGDTKKTKKKSKEGWSFDAKSAYSDIVRFVEENETDDLSDFLISSRGVAYITFLFEDFLSNRKDLKIKTGSIDVENFVDNYISEHLGNDWVDFNAFQDTVKEGLSVRKQSQIRQMAADMALNFRSRLDSLRKTRLLYGKRIFVYGEKFIREANVISVIHQGRVLRIPFQGYKMCRSFDGSAWFDSLNADFFLAGGAALREGLSSNFVAVLATSSLSGGILMCTGSNSVSQVSQENFEGYLTGVLSLADGSVIGPSTGKISGKSIYRTDRDLYNRSVRVPLLEFLENGDTRLTISTKRVGQQVFFWTALFDQNRKFKYFKQLISNIGGINE